MTADPRRELYLKTAAALKPALDRVVTEPAFRERLEQAPLAVLDYIVIHELAHLKEGNHSPRFWALVAEQCPDYHEHRAWLRQHGPELHF